MNLDVMDRKNNLKKQEEDPQPRQYSDKRNLSQGRNVISDMTFLSTYEYKGKKCRNTFRLARFFLLNLLTSVALACVSGF